MSSHTRRSSRDRGLPGSAQRERVSSSSHRNRLSSSANHEKTGSSSNRERTSGSSTSRDHGPQSPTQRHRSTSSSRDRTPTSSARDKSSSHTREKAVSSSQRTTRRSEPPSPRTKTRGKEDDEKSKKRRERRAKRESRRQNDDSSDESPDMTVKPMRDLLPKYYEAPASPPASPPTHHMNWCAPGAPHIYKPEIPRPIVQKAKFKLQYPAGPGRGRESQTPDRPRSYTKYPRIFKFDGELKNEFNFPKTHMNERRMAKKAGIKRVGSMTMYKPDDLEFIDLRLTDSEPKKESVMEGLGRRRNDEDSSDSDSIPSPTIRRASLDLNWKPRPKSNLPRSKPIPIPSREDQMRERMERERREERHRQYWRIEDARANYVHPRYIPVGKQYNRVDSDSTD